MCDHACGDLSCTHSHLPRSPPHVCKPPKRTPTRMCAPLPKMIYGRVPTTQVQVKFPEFVKEHLGEWPGLIVVDRDYDTRVQQQQQQQQQPLDRAQEDIRTDTPPQRQPPSGSQQRGRRRMIKGAGAGSGGAANVVAEYGSDLVLGLHQGYWFYTVGQRGGIKLPGGPWCACAMHFLHVTMPSIEQLADACALCLNFWLVFRWPELA